MGAGKTPDAWDAWTYRMRAEHGNGNGHGKSLEIEALRLLPTPTVSESTGPGEHGTGGANLRTVVDALLPTPTAVDAAHSGRMKIKSHQQMPLSASVNNLPPQDWAQYEAAIRRHEQALGRPAPPPTEPGTKGQPRLSPAFVEWLMMLRAGHVTNPAIGIAANDQLKALGNGVVPAQCAAATRQFLADSLAERVA